MWRLEGGRSPQLTARMMEIVFEFVFDVIFEGIIELATNKKISKWVRYPLIALISVVYMGIIIFVSLLTYLVIQDNMLGGIFLFLLVIVLLLMGVSFYRRKIK